MFRRRRHVIRELTADIDMEAAKLRAFALAEEMEELADALLLKAQALKEELDSGG